MKESIYIKLAFILSLCGTLFAGYLSANKFLTDTCPFNEPCPFFFGYPACYFGFGMFLFMFLISFFALIKRIFVHRAGVVLGIISFFGILFAGYFTVVEISRYLSSTYQKPTLILPTCAYGLIFYLAIFIISVIERKTHNV